MVSRRIDSNNFKWHEQIETKVQGVRIVLKPAAIVKRLQQGIDSRQQDKVFIKLVEMVACEIRFQQNKGHKRWGVNFV